MAAVKLTMDGGSERCQVCGLPKSAWLDENCPGCLMRLGTTSDLYDSWPEQSTSSQHIRRLGDYELLEELARGGMGIVYRARQVSLDRLVALKLLPGGPFAVRTFVERFRREAAAAASLSHPNIVTVHEVGEHEGQLYFSMELIEGQSLADAIRERPFAERHAAELTRTVAEAIGFAHSRELLHRDLKPSNVLLDHLGVPHITDFGLAKWSGDDSDLTLTGQVLGSPNYMAPEQAEPSLGPITAASDVYSLGAMLYHVLTGRPPFMAETPGQTLRMVAEGQLLRPGRLRRGLSRDLETICLKCLETDPARRYRSARELADELERFLHHEPITARPINRFVRLLRWCRRKPASAAAVGAFVGLALVVILGSTFTRERVETERRRSDTARIREVAARRRAGMAAQVAREQLYSALVERARASIHSGEIGQRLDALEAIRRAAVITNSVELRQLALSALALPDLRFEREVQTGPGYTLQRIDPEFKTAALCRGTGAVEIRDVSDGRLRASLPASTNLPAYLGWWSRNGRYLAVKRDYPTQGDRADLEVWDVPTKTRRLLIHDVAGHAFSFHPQGHQLLTARNGGPVELWDPQQATRLCRFDMAGAPERIEFSPDGDRFCTVQEVADQFKVCVLDSVSGTERSSHSFADRVMDVAWQPNGRWLAIADDAGVVRLWDWRTDETRELGSHKAQAATLAFTPDGDYLWSGGWEGELLCWDVRTRQRVLCVQRQSWTAQFRADGNECALVTASGILLHSFERPSVQALGEDLDPRLRRAVFSPDSRWLAASWEHCLGVWDLDKSKRGTYAKEINNARPVFAPNGSELLATSEGGQCRQWQLVPGTDDTPPVLHPVALPLPGSVTSVCAASNTLAFTGGQGSGIVRASEFDASRVDWVSTSSGINGISSDAKWLGVFRPYTPVLSVYHLPGLKPAATILNQGNISDFAFSPQGGEVAVSSRHGVEFWSTETWRQTRRLTNFSAILFSPEGSTCWLIRDFRTAGLYRSETLELLVPLPAGVLPLALSPDGRRLAVGVDGRRLQLWDVPALRKHLEELGLHLGQIL